MKKIIKNKLYDTNTAKRIGSREHNQPGDLSWWEETLYLKRTGEYFIHGEGGAMTKYAERRGENRWSGGEAITPVSFETARAWAEENLDAERYSEAFGLPSESDGEKSLYITVPAALMAQIKASAAANRQSIKDYVTDILAKAADVK